MAEPRFRWWYTDDALGEHWSAWHTITGRCTACCCGGPEDGEHLEPSEYYDEDGILTNGHSRMDPNAADELDKIEWEG